MNSKLIAAGLLGLTAATVAFFPLVEKSFATPHVSQAPPIGPGDRPPGQGVSPKVEVVFVLDTTGSMGGLIAAAKEKIWSIATTMASANEAPEIKMGLVAYRDRGDAYVTRVFDLSSDLDTLYATLMDFRAAGGGDGPESVNQALHEAVHRISWSTDSDTYRVVFLVGDAPPHMDYPDDVPYPRTLDAAKGKGIVVNAIQAGRLRATRQPWEHIASLGHGQYFNVDSTGDAVAIATPFDAELATLSKKLDETRLYYGDDAHRARQREKQAAAARLHEEASPEIRARRAAFNASKSGALNLLGERELVDDAISGRVDLDAIEPAALPESLRAMPAEARDEVVKEKAKEREGLAAQIKNLADRRDAYLESKVEALGGARGSLDQKLYDAVRAQAAAAGLTYESDAPRY